MLCAGTGCAATEARAGEVCAAAAAARTSPRFGSALRSRFCAGSCVSLSTSTAPPAVIAVAQTTAAATLQAVAAPAPPTSAAPPPPPAAAAPPPPSSLATSASGPAPIGASAANERRIPRRSRR